jgi:hypothetical protein
MIFSAASLRESPKRESVEARFRGIFFLFVAYCFACFALFALLCLLCYSVLEYIFCAKIDLIFNLVLVSSMNVYKANVSSISSRFETRMETADHQYY